MEGTGIELQIMFNNSFMKEVIREGKKFKGGNSGEENLNVLYNEKAKQGVLLIQEMDQRSNLCVLV